MEPTLFTVADLSSLKCYEACGSWGGTAALGRLLMLRLRIECFKIFHSPAPLDGRTVQGVEVPEIKNNSTACP